MDEFIDLCDSDNDGVVALPAHNSNSNSNSNNNNNNNSANDDKDDDSSSSSSSEDSYLWKVDVPKGSPPKEDVRRGNYFKEIRKKYGDDDDNRKWKQTKRQKLPVLGSSSNEGGVHDSKGAVIDNYQPSNDYDKKSESRMKLSPLVSDIGKQSSLSKQSSLMKQSSLTNLSQDGDKELDCIEIDSSSDDCDASSGIKLTAKIAAKKYHTCKKKNSPMKKKSYNCSSNDDDDDDDLLHSTKLCQDQKKSTDKSKCGETMYYLAQNTCTVENINFSSQSTDSTVSLPIDMLSPEMKEYKKLSIQEKKKKFAVSILHNSDDIKNDNDDVRGVGTSFGSFGRFDKDDDRRIRNGSNESHPSNKIESKPKVKPKSSLNDEIELLDDSSENSVNSESSAELFTPRFIKNAKKPATLNLETYATANSSESGLSTPCAFSPATTSPTMGAYASKRKIPTPAIPAVPAALVREIGGKLYPDLRHNFLVALTSHARRSNKNAFQRASFDSALRSVVVIGLHTRPLRSAEAARRIKGVGSTFYDILKESVNGTKGNKPFAPAAGKYSCVAAAALVSLLELEESNASIASANGQSFPMEDLIRKINELLDSRANASLNQTATKYCQPTNLDPGWGQVKKLSSANAVTELGGPFIKGRTKKDSCASGRLYELLDNGREIARKLRALARLGPAEDGPLRQYPEDTIDEEFGAVTVSMDFREGGGCGKGLHRICDQLDIRGVPYVVRELKVADFLFFNGDKLAPLLIERKTAEDVASSIHDGRWERQQRNMRKAQFVLGGGPGRRCKVCYIIEGDPSKKTVHGGNVGRHTWFQSVEDVTQAIDKLPMLGFGVMRTKSNLDTIGLLAKIAADVSWNVKNGSMESILTYKEFTTRVKALGEDVGDPPTPNASLASYSPPWTQHQNPAPPVVWNTEHIPPAHNGNEKDNFSPQSDNGQSNAQFSQGSKASSNASRAETAHHDENSEEYRQLIKLSITELKEKCKDRDEKISGKKNDLIARLLKPRKPEILIMRARRNDYNPKVPSCNAALMVALLNHHVVGTPGLTKDRLMVLAEGTGVSTESMGGDGGFYDGWAGMKQLLTGDPAIVRKEKGHKYSLTTQPPETCGRAVAHALHILAHREGLCKCDKPPSE